MVSGGPGRGQGRKPGRQESKISVKATPKEKRRLSDMAKEYTEEALLTLVEIMRNPEEMGHTRLSAANALLDRGYGKPAQAIQHENADGAPLFTLIQGMIAEDELEEEMLVIDHRPFEQQQADPSYNGAVGDDRAVGDDKEI